MGIRAVLQLNPEL